MHQFSRRQVIKGAAAVTAGASISVMPSMAATQAGARTLLVPEKLNQGDTVAIVAPAGVTYEKLYLKLAIESLEALGLKVKVGANVLQRFGYLAGTDQQRATDIMTAFTDKSVKAIFCLRGGWGSARLLPLLDYDIIRKNAKIIIGYSDITALLNAIYTLAGVVTYHGPNAGSPWREFSVAQLRALLFTGEKTQIKNIVEPNNSLVPRDNLPQTIVGGKATGKLIGGNMTVFNALLGSPYLPDFSGHILCLEEVGEWIYRCDRMISQLALAGIFEQVSGVAFGHFTRCDVEPNGGYGNFALMDIFEQHLGKLNKPVYYGAQFGHIGDKYTLPFGINAEMDADQGTIRLLTPSVS